MAIQRLYDAFDHEIAVGTWFLFEQAIISLKNQNDDDNKNDETTSLLRVSS